jgi:hypothetical protein
MCVEIDFNPACWYTPVAEPALLYLRRELRYGHFGRNRCLLRVQATTFTKGTPTRLFTTQFKDPTTVSTLPAFFRPVTLWVPGCIAWDLHEIFIFYNEIQLNLVITTSVCATPFLQLYTFCGTNRFPARHVFFFPAYYVIHKDIYLGYKDSAIYNFQYNVPRSKLFWEFNHLLLLKKEPHLCFHKGTQI